MMTARLSIERRDEAGNVRTETFEVPFEAGQSVLDGLAREDLEPVPSVVPSIHDQLVRLGDDAVLAAGHTAQYFLVRADAEKADIQVVGFRRQVKR